MNVPRPTRLAYQLVRRHAAKKFGLNQLGTFGLARMPGEVRRHVGLYEIAYGARAASTARRAVKGALTQKPIDFTVTVNIWPDGDEARCSGYF